MRRHPDRSAADLSPNLTSLIDVTFLLIVFFVLVSKIVEMEHAALDLPAPPDALTTNPTKERQTVINVIPGAGGEAAGYAIRELTFAADPDGVENLVAHLAGLYAADPHLSVNVRADRATHYEFVHPAMRAVTMAAVRSGAPDATPRVNLVVERRRQ